MLSVGLEVAGACFHLVNALCMVRSVYQSVCPVPVCGRAMRETPKASATAFSCPTETSTIGFDKQSLPSYEAGELGERRYGVPTQTLSGFSREGQYHDAERWNWGVAGEDGLQVSLGRDWKHECRIERCDLLNGGLCCFPVCEAGGDSGVASEPPDRFGCMNVAAGENFE